MAINHHQIVLELFKLDGTRLGLAKAEIDWEPAAEWTRFFATRRGLLPLTGPLPSARIEPVWHRTSGEPYLQGFRVALAQNGTCNVVSEFPVAYFRNAARLAAECFVERGKLSEGEEVRFQTAAYERRDLRTGKDEPRFESEEVEPFIPFRGTALSAYLGAALPEGTVEDEDMPFFVPRQVLGEIASATRELEGREAGGVLIGLLHRDSSLPEIFAEVTAQIPVAGSGSSTKLTFTPDSWTAVRAAVTLRRRSEVYLGYWHSHPVREWCRESECSPEKLRKCSLARGFFSVSDQAVLRAAFSRAWNVGLVCNDAPLSDLTFSMFGWRRGLIEPRGFYVMEEPNAP